MRSSSYLEIARTKWRRAFLPAFPASQPASRHHMRMAAWILAPILERVWSANLCDRSRANRSGAEFRRTI